MFPAAHFPAAHFPSGHWPKTVGSVSVPLTPNFIIVVPCDDYVIVVPQEEPEIIS